MLLRMFVLLYDTEVVEEEAFLKWKEDVSEKYPGKGKALFQVRSELLIVFLLLICLFVSTDFKFTFRIFTCQVNSWLTWLETADEEGTDSEAE